MERRVLIAVFLSFLVLYGYQSLFVPTPPEQTGSTPTAPAAQQPAAVSQPAAAAPAGAAPAEAAPAAVVGDVAAREIVVDTATVRAVLSNRGARVVRWQLKEYRDATGESVDLIPSGLAS